MTLLNPDFKWLNNSLSSSFDRVTTGMCNLQPVISNFATVGESSLTSGLPSCAAVTNLFSKLVITQFLSHVKLDDT